MGHRRERQATCGLYIGQDGCRANAQAPSTRGEYQFAAEETGAGVTLPPAKLQMRRFCRKEAQEAQVEMRVAHHGFSLRILAAILSSCESKGELVAGGARGAKKESSGLGQRELAYLKLRCAEIDQQAVFNPAGPQIP